MIKNKPQIMTREYVCDFRNRVNDAGSSLRGWKDYKYENSAIADEDIAKRLREQCWVVSSIADTLELLKRFDREEIISQFMNKPEEELRDTRENVKFMKQHPEIYEGFYLEKVVDILDKKTTDLITDINDAILNTEIREGKYSQACHALALLVNEYRVWFKKEAGNVLFNGRDNRPENLVTMLGSMLTYGNQHFMKRLFGHYRGNEDLNKSIVEFARGNDVDLVSKLRDSADENILKINISEDAIVPSTAPKIFGRLFTAKGGSMYEIELIANKRFAEMKVTNGRPTHLTSYHPVDHMYSAVLDLIMANKGYINKEFEMNTWKGWRLRIYNPEDNQKSEK